jgi:hypothetical protein
LELRNTAKVRYISTRILLWIDSRKNLLYYARKKPSNSLATDERLSPRVGFLS